MMNGPRKAENEPVVLEWIVPSDLIYFNGHFPNEPILPGFYVIERSFEVIQELRPNQKWELHQAKFLAPIKPAEAFIFNLKQAAESKLVLQWISSKENQKKADLEFSRLES